MAFSKHLECKSGYDVSACKACKKAKVDWKAVPLERRIYNRAKSRAKRKGLDFTIEISDIIIPYKCPILGVPFIYSDSDYTYSIDRIDSSKGYIKGNIIIMSNKANRIKNNATKREIELVLNFLNSYEVV